MTEKKVPTKGEFLRYDFTEEEIRDKAKQLALAIQTQTQAQEEQKVAQAQFKERIEAQVSVIGRLSRSINMGWEMRTIDCRIEFHTPVQGTKRLTRIDTGEFVRDEAMSPHEMQEQLFKDDDMSDVDVAASVAASEAAAQAFFGRPEAK